MNRAPDLPRVTVPELSVTEPELASQLGFMVLSELDKMPLFGYVPELADLSTRLPLLASVPEPVVIEMAPPMPGDEPDVPASED